MLRESSPNNLKRKKPRRSAHPCDICRRRKTRCVIEDGKDACVFCLSRRVVCTFEDKPFDRPSSISSSRDAVSLSDPTRTLVSPLVYEQSMVALSPQPRLQHASAEGFINDNPNNNHQRSQNPAYQPDLLDTNHDTNLALSQPHDHSTTSPNLSLGDSTTREPQRNKTLGLSSQRFAELYGLTSDMEPILMRHRPYDPITNEFILETHRIRRVQETDQGQDYPITFHTVSDEKAIGYMASYAEVDTIEACVRPHGPFLVQIFWRMVQPSYPILFKAGFMKKYSSSYRLISGALLGAVYLISLSWWSYETELSIRPAPNAGQLRKLTMQAIQNSYHRPKLSSIEALLLLLQCKPEDPLNPDHTFAWAYVSQALGIAESIGLHLDASEWEIPQWEKNLRKRLGWALYMQDKWMSIAYGRPPHIHEDNWVLKDLTLSDFSEEENGIETTSTARPSLNSYEEAGKEQFRQMVELTKILVEVQNNFYTVKTAVSQDSVQLYRDAAVLVVKLNKWYAELPHTLQMDVRYQRQLNPHGYLHFSYHGVMINLLRRLVRSTALPPRCEDSQTLTEIRQLGLETAQAAMNLVSSLRPDHLEAFWFCTTPYLFSLLGSFITLLLVTSLSSQERNYWQDSLNSYLWTLRMMSKSSEPMRYAANRLEGAILRGLEHALAVNIDENVAEYRQFTGLGGEGFEFTDFGDWDLAAVNLNAYDLLAGVDLRGFQPSTRG